jgi:hypothetical protein
LEQYSGGFRRKCACKLGCKGIVSKRFGSKYRPDWIKVKNPAAPEVRHEAEEDWGSGDEDEADRTADQDL